MAEPLLDAREFELVHGLGLTVRKRVGGLAAGEQRSASTGGGIEFADYREYRPGDDPRTLDWPVYLRMRKLLVRVSAEEKELTVMVLVDGSRSMEAGSPSKLRFAKRVACITAGIAMEGGARAGLCLAGGKLIEVSRPERSRSSLFDFVRAAESAHAEGEFRPLAAMGEFAARYGRKCLAFLVSDLLYPDWRETLRALAATGCEAHVAQLLAPEELDPPWRGPVTTLDAEDGSGVPHHLDARALASYRRELASFLAGARGACAALGLGYSFLTSDMSLERAFRVELRRGGLVC